MYIEIIIGFLLIVIMYPLYIPLFIFLEEVINFLLYFLCENILYLLFYLIAAKYYKGK